MFCCKLLCVHSSFPIILVGKRELVALLSLSSWCLVIVVCLFFAVPWICLQLVIVVFPNHTHLLFLTNRRVVKHKISLVRNVSSQGLTNRDDTKKGLSTHRLSKLTKTQVNAFKNLPHGVGCRQF